jgi:hypothetical protein
MPTKVRRLSKLRIGANSCRSLVCERTAGVDPSRSFSVAFWNGSSCPKPDPRIPLASAFLRPAVSSAAAISIPSQRQFPVPSRSASSSLFVFSSAWLEEDQLPQQPSLSRLRDPIAMCGQSIPLSVPPRERGRIGPNAGPHSAAPRHPRSTPRDGRTPIWYDQAMDEPGWVSDARLGEGSRRVQPDRARL